MLENTTEYSFLDNFYFSSNIKYSLADNFDDLQYPPVDTYPAQVRSDVKIILKTLMMVFLLEGRNSTTTFL